MKPNCQQCGMPASIRQPESQIIPDLAEMRKTIYANSPEPSLPLSGEVPASQLCSLCFAGHEQGWRKTDELFLESEIRITIENNTTGERVTLCA